MKKKRRQMHDQKIIRISVSLRLYEFMTQYNGKIDFENLY